VIERPALPEGLRDEIRVVHHQVPLNDMDASAGNLGGEIIERQRGGPHALGGSVVGKNTPGEVRVAPPDQREITLHAAVRSDGGGGLDRGAILEIRSEARQGSGRRKELGRGRRDEAFVRVNCSNTLARSQRDNFDTHVSLPGHVFVQDRANSPLQSGLLRFLREGREDR
ncbi:MAG: hypothetical protein HW398_1027, partial [Acidobacteria bacterium]|nr:hypothetical protein [Acidobacteriota bacterium]